MTEHSFVRSIHDKLRGKVFIWKINARFANGVPDAWYSGKAGDVWVEYKWGAYKVSELQNKWLTDRFYEGRRCWLVVGNEDGIRVVDAPPYTRQKIADQKTYSLQEYVKILCDACTLPQTTTETI
jgi:hypothetical protein